MKHSIVFMLGFLTLNRVMNASAITKQSLVDLAVFGGFFLPFFLGYVEVCKSYDCTKGEHYENGQVAPVPHAYGIADNCGKYSEADSVTK